MPKQKHKLKAEYTHSPPKKGKHPRLEERYPSTIIYQELRNRSGYDSDKAYIEQTENPCYFKSKEDRAFINKVFHDYREALKANKQSDCGLVEFNIARAFPTIDLSDATIIADEAQEASLGLLAKPILRMSCQ